MKRPTETPPEALPGADALAGNTINEGSIVQSFPEESASLRRVEDWKDLSGLQIELRFKGIIQRHGRIETIMPDASGLWLAAHTPYTRIYVDQASGYEIWAADPEEDPDPDDKNAGMNHVNDRINL